MPLGEVMSDGSESEFGFRGNRNDHMTMTVTRRRSEDEDGGKVLVKAEINTPPSLGWRKGNEDKGFSSRGRGGGVLGQFGNYSLFMAPCQEIITITNALSQYAFTKPKAIFRNFDER